MVPAAAPPFAPSAWMFAVKVSGAPVDCVAAVREEASSRRNGGVRMELFENALKLLFEVSGFRSSVVIHRTGPNRAARAYSPHRSSARGRRSRFRRG